MKPRLFCLSITAIVAVFILSFSMQSAIAQNNAPSAPPAASPASGTFKIGVVELQKVMDSYNRQKDEVAVLEKDAKTKEDALKAKWDQFDQKKKDFESKRATMDEAAANRQESDLQREFTQFQSDIKMAEDDLNRGKQVLKRTLIKDILAAVEAIGAQENYHLVLEADPDTRTGVLYYSSVLDMTQKVVDYLNKQYGPAKATPASASKSEAKPKK